MDANKTISPLIWLWLPLVWLILQLFGEFTLSTDTILRLHAEGSAHEIIQFGFMTVAFFLCFITLIKMDKKKNIALTLWITLAMLGSFYVAVEEVSWGQSFFQWQTPETLKQINNQGETNIHNTSRLFNHIPRYILMIGIVIGGLIIPALQKFKPSLLPLKFNIIYPPAFLSVTAIIFVMITVGNKAAKLYFDTKFFERGSEVEEIFMYFFVLLYIIVLKKKILPSR